MFLAFVEAGLEQDVRRGDPEAGSRSPRPTLTFLRGTWSIPPTFTGSSR